MVMGRSESEAGVAPPRSRIYGESCALCFKLLWDVATIVSCHWTKTVVLPPTWGNVIIKKTQILEVQKCLEHGGFFFWS